MAGRNYVDSWNLQVNPKFKKPFKTLAIQQERPVYEVVDEALAEYAANHGLGAA